eukprot:752302-Hanusia_phi.AAC.13
MQPNPVHASAQRCGKHTPGREPGAPGRFQRLHPRDGAAGRKRPARPARGAPTAHGVLRLRRHQLPGGLLPPPAELLPVRLVLVVGDGRKPVGDARQLPDTAQLHALARGAVLHVLQERRVLRRAGPRRDDPPGALLRAHREREEPRRLRQEPAEAGMRVAPGQPEGAGGGQPRPQRDGAGVQQREHDVPIPRVAEHPHRPPRASEHVRRARRARGRAHADHPWHARIHAAILCRHRPAPPGSGHCVQRLPAVRPPAARERRTAQESAVLLHRGLHRLRAATSAAG